MAQICNLQILAPQKGSAQLFQVLKIQVVIYHQEIAIWVPNQ